MTAIRITIAVAVALAVTAAAVLETPVSIKTVRDGVLAGTLRTTGAGFAPCDPTVTQYSGWLTLDAAQQKNYFFWAFESKNDPATDPVILWMTGGPGCAGELAILAENGPCHIYPNGTLWSNPYSWNYNATVIYIDQPADVGFSYTKSTSGLDYNETMVANDMLVFINAFYKAYPKFASVPLHVVGESYGGHFAPATAARYLVANQQKEGATIPLQGLAVGNGLTAPLVQYDGYYAELAYTWCATVKGKPCITKAQYEQQLAQVPACVAAIAKCQNNNTGCADAQDTCGNSQMNPYFNTGLNPYDVRIPCEVPGLCYNFSAMTAFLNRADVQQSLGVASAGITWQTCDYTVNGMFANDWMRDFSWAAKLLLENEVRVMIYAGDMDFICNWLGNKAWTLGLDWTQKTAFNSAPDVDWYEGFKYAGRTRFVPGVKNKHLFTFVQVEGAGHMVPQDQPLSAQKMIYNHLFDLNFN